MMLEQFGGATGELTASLTYLTHSFHMDDPGIRDMLQDIETEELGHLEVVAMLIEQQGRKKLWSRRRGVARSSRDEADGGAPCPKLMT